MDAINWIMDLILPQTGETDETMAREGQPSTRQVGMTQPQSDSLRLGVTAPTGTTQAASTSQVGATHSFSTFRTQPVLSTQQLQTSSVLQSQQPQAASVLQSQQPQAASVLQSQQPQAASVLQSQEALAIQLLAEARAADIAFTRSRAPPVVRLVPLPRRQIPVARKKKATPQFDATASSRRLMLELNEIAKNPPPLCTARVKNNDIYEWVATVQGPPDSPYEGGVFSLNLAFPRDYPFRPPRVHCTTKIYHCNISTCGIICLDTLSVNWSPAMRVEQVLLTIIALLTDANPRSPLNSEAARLYRSDRAEHDRIARDTTRRFALP